MAAAAGLPAVARAAAQTAALTPEQFGARGNGIADDTAAFAALAERINRAGGGVIVLRRAVYRVGGQRRPSAAGAQFAYEPSPILELRNCRGPIVIEGNGATLRCAPGLRYGTFDPRTGAATRNAMPYLGRGELASPYRWMIFVQECRGPVEISDLELDGNAATLRIGGEFGDVGRQIPATGIGLYDNRGPERLSRIWSHSHALDGIIIDGFDGVRAGSARTVLEDVRCERNGRQGCSIVGGRGIDLVRSAFNGTGRGPISSPPGAGVDIEAEGGKRVRDLSFRACEFSNNVGCGLVADSGDSDGASFSQCRFVGATNWAAWPRKPNFRFSDCTFVGPIVACHGSRERPAEAVRFTGCTFHDDPALSPTQQVFGGTNPDRPIADLSDARNVLFERCRFILSHNAVLPWSTGAIYRDCIMSQHSPRQGYPRGYYLGRNIVQGNVDLAGSRINGELIVNGQSSRATESWSATRAGPAKAA